MSSQPQRVLLIEDNPGDVYLVCLKLLESKTKFEVCCADRLSTGMAALTKEAPAVILLDLYLPDSRGAATIQSVVDWKAGVPVIVLTAEDDEELAIDAVSRGAQDYIVKGTFDGNRLGLTLRCAIERQALVNALSTNEKKQLTPNDRVRPDVLGLFAPLISIRRLVTMVLDDYGSPITTVQSQHLETVLLDVKRLDSALENILMPMWTQTED